METVYSIDGPTDRSTELPAVWFGAEINRNAMYQATRAQRTNRRAGTASTLTRAEVRGGGAKPWRQKGTGRARAGSIRSPLWEGGGVIHGPKPKRWSERVPRRLRQSALASALSVRAREGKIRLVDLSAFDEPKTARMARALERWEVEGRVLLLTARYDEKVALSARNIRRLTVKQFRDASALDVLDHDSVVVEEAAWSTRPEPGRGAPAGASVEEGGDG